MNNRYALILCGGSGTRLWPVSHTLRPKQLLAFNGDQTLLQQTAQRLTRHVGQTNLLTVTHEDHEFEVKGQSKVGGQKTVEIWAGQEEQDAMQRVIASGIFTMGVVSYCKSLLQITQISLFRKKLVRVVGSV